MSQFSDSEFSLEALEQTPSADSLPHGGLAEVQLALRVQRLQQRLPHLRERALSALERLDSQPDTHRGPQDRSRVQLDGQDDL